MQWTKSSLESLEKEKFKKKREKEKEKKIMKICLKGIKQDPNFLFLAKIGIQRFVNWSWFESLIH